MRSARRLGGAEETEASQGETKLNEKPELDEAELLLRDVKRDREMIFEYCKHYVESCSNTWLIKPYFPGGLDPSFDERHNGLQHMHALSMVDENNESDDSFNV